MQKMKISLAILLLMILLWNSSVLAAAPTYVLVVHKDSPINTLHANMIKRIFLGKTKRWSNGNAITLIYNKKTDTHTAFSNDLLRKSPRQLSAYWKRNLFSGKSMLPKTVYGNEAVKQLISTQQSAISYIDSDALDDSVKILRIKQ